MPKREDSSLILQNLKKREFPALGRPVVPLEQAEAQLTTVPTTTVAEPTPDRQPPSASSPERPADSRSAIEVVIDEAISSAIEADSTSGTTSVAEPRPTASKANQPAVRTRLQPRRRVARSALLVRIDPELHRRLEEVARYNSLTMNDIVVEAIELHLDDFMQPPRVRT